MKKKLFLTAILTLICCMLLIAGASADLEGTGTADDPYQISNAVELIAFADIVNNGQNGAHAVLTADITIQAITYGGDGKPANADGLRQWTPIGKDDTNAYTGTFDGQAHTISGLYTMVKTDNTTAYAGLFGCVGGGGEVKNVNIADSYIYASIKESNPSGNNEFAAAGSVTLPDPGPGKAYFDETGKYVDPETYKFTDGMRRYLEDAITASFVYGDGTSVTQIVKEDISSVVMPDAPSKPGYIFMGWRGGDMTYLPGDEVGLYGDTTFTAVWANMPDITPTEPDEGLPFTDVTEDAWYYDAVKTVYEAGLMNGVTDTLFDPDGTLTRAMFWTLLARAGGVDTDGGATWYAVAQQWAVDNGVSDGADAMGALTREQLVTMLWRLNGEPVVNYLITAPDAADISSWALEAMRWAASTGLIEGDETGALNPTATCTRAQAATFMVRYLTPVTA